MGIISIVGGIRSSITCYVSRGWLAVESWAAPRDLNVNQTYGLMEEPKQLHLVNPKTQECSISNFYKNIMLTMRIMIRQKQLVVIAFYSSSAVFESKGLGDLECCMRRDCQLLGEFAPKLQY